MRFISLIRSLNPFLVLRRYFEGRVHLSLDGGSWYLLISTPPFLLSSYRHCSHIVPSLITKSFPEFVEWADRPDGKGFPGAPMISISGIFNGRRHFTAGQKRWTLPFWVNSPILEWPRPIPLPQQDIHGFYRLDNGILTWSTPMAPAFNMAPVAMALVPKPMISISSEKVSRRRWWSRFQFHPPDHQSQRWIFFSSPSLTHPIKKSHLSLHLLRS